MNKTRLIPQQILIGDTVLLKDISLPAAEEGEAWSRASLNMRRIRDTEVTVLVETDDTITENLATIEIPAATSATMANGAYRYQISITSDAGSVVTLEQGVVVLADPLDPQKDYNEDMVDIVREVIRLRMTESADVSGYTLGDRQVQLLSLRELRMLLAEFEEKLFLQRGGKRYQTRRRINF